MLDLNRESRVNPLAQLGGLILLLFPALLSFDPRTPLLVLAVALPLTAIWLRPAWRACLHLVLPILILAAGLFIMNLLFTPSRSGHRILWHWGAITVTDFSLFRACAVFNRALTLTVLSTLTATAFGPLALVRALMQQLRLNPVWGYSLYAGLNVLPLTIRDLETMQQARAVRTAGRRMRFSECLSLPILLLASAIRRAERISLSMAARELETCHQRTFCVRSFWRPADSLYLFVCGLLAAAIFFTAKAWGFFHFNLG